ncbi:DEAD/DEAH box helicase [Phytoactinopolyspora alkaliphila]|uniref:RNA helicase n=1 Tax=Phytoactinopolyspora alkaliphila TaxID=1783498 RepID=A0A6N9YQD4_9ACTN|nr:DEAD/DEAH box helicase [Phytoactinopolyspora alkaliphila]NED97184.1 DEAD/DEAH box helicase [Phytoactinopolyspora alkaliphila]
MRRNALTTFRDLGVLPAIADALERVGITEAFPIQELALPAALTGSDLIGQARTGTGKTLAFGIPLLQRIVAPDERDYAEATEPGKPQALVVVPTRELAIQVTGDLETASTVRRVRILSVFGGRAYEPQVKALRTGVDVVVGTPGRLLDLAGQGLLDLSHVKVLVLDEADEMLDLGFLPDVEKLIANTHELRQTMLFSATMPGGIVGLARKYMRHPLNIRAESSDATQTVPLTAQFVYRVHNLDKEEMIARLLQAEGRGLSMIFSRTKRAAQRLADDLADRGFAVAAVHGDLGQGAREQALRAFRSGKVDVLVATDVAARGIDVEAVTHVVNLSCPEDEKTYLHRIGRTGRAGASGIAVTFVDWEDLARWKMIAAALDLPFEEPAETYSSSESFFHDLGIPPGTKGTLPRDQRTRAGLRAETLEDVGGEKKKPRRSSSSRGSRSGRDGQGDNRGGQRGRGRGTPASESTSESRSAETRPRRRNRRRTRGGKPVDSKSGE